MINVGISLATTLKTNMTTENPQFEDIFPIEHGDFPMSSQLQKNIGTMPIPSGCPGVMDQGH